MNASARHTASERSRRRSGSRSKSVRPTGEELIERALCGTLSWLTGNQVAKLRSVASIERFAAHSTVPTEDGRIRFLVTGALRCRFTDTGCQDQLSYFLGPGDVAANLFFCSPGTLRVYDAVIDSSLLSIPLEPFANAIAGVPWRSFKRSVAEMLRSPFSLLALLNRQRGVPAVSRLAQVLLHLASKFGVKDSRGTILTLKVTNTDLAALAGCSRQQLTVLLNELAKCGAAVKEGSRMALDITRLNAIARPGMADRANRADASAPARLELNGNARTSDASDAKPTGKHRLHSLKP
jgi:CRP/FNR family transcriptional regulator, cyclic AMP receptor protein